jgi:hypothetical protein
LNITIPGVVREVGDGALLGLDSVASLTFDEGTVHIGAHAFDSCYRLQKAAFPASLIGIEANAFRNCRSLHRITFAVGSQLQYIRSGAFSRCALEEVAIPATVVEIDPSAFSVEVWRKCVTKLFLIDDDFIRSVDSRVIFRYLSHRDKLVIRSNIEVIGTNAFRASPMSAVVVESGTKLREIASGAFAECSGLTEFTVPESVEVIGDECFQGCSNMKTIAFEGSSRLKRIGERAFLGCNMDSITIPALTEAIDGSAFVNCPLTEIQVAPGSLNFKVEGNLLVTSDGTQIVRYFGMDREITVGRRIRVLGKSCFEGCKHLDRINSEIGSELERIGEAALRGCESLTVIEIPDSVERIEGASFEGCVELDSCLISQNSSLVTIGARAFAKCTSLRSFDIPPQVGEIGMNCFSECNCLHRLKFMSSESLARILGARSLDECLEEFGATAHSSLFRIDIEDGEVQFEFRGWRYIGGEEGDLKLSLVRYHQ